MRRIGTASTRRFGILCVLAFLLSSCSYPAVRYSENTRFSHQNINAGIDGNPTSSSKIYKVGRYEGATDHYTYRQKNNDIRPVRLTDRPTEVLIPKMANQQDFTDMPLVIEANDVLFEFDKSVIREAFIPEINLWVQYFLENPSVTAEIYGHADSTGTVKYNQGLSERRAAAVLNYMVANGVSRDRLTAKGFGELNPVAPNDTKAGRQKNRRVELHL
ncbi:MAG: hypothetical protein CSB23_00295 [Deltaproteobacteria bacterium]|nr:MAG: hypothetical protein CSB23_00295 [Deltaproteobacteria bacterium]